jgi:hypothetical protein
VLRRIPPRSQPPWARAIRFAAPAPEPPHGAPPATAPDLCGARLTSDPAGDPATATFRGGSAEVFCSSTQQYEGPGGAYSYHRWCEQPHTCETLAGGGCGHPVPLCGHGTRVADCINDADFRCVDCLGESPRGCPRARWRAPGPESRWSICAALSMHPGACAAWAGPDARALWLIARPGYCGGSACTPLTCPPGYFLWVGSLRPSAPFHTADDPHSTMSAAPARSALLGEPRRT